MFAPIATVSNNVLKVKSNGRIIVRLEVVKKIVMTLVLILTIPHSRARRERGACRRWLFSK